MRLIACHGCHAQYDVTNVARKQIDCRCGLRIDNCVPAAIEAEVRRCSACGAQLGGSDSHCDYCGSEIVRDRRMLSLICPECCARNAEAARFCTGCGITFRPEAVRMDDQGREFSCPVCTCLMPQRTVGDVLINECPTCNGIWAAEDRFEALVNRAIEAKRDGNESFEGFSPRVKGSNPAAQQVQYRKCPECDGFMQRRNFRKTSGVIIDRCNSHGVWLDMDELEQIAGFILSGGRPRADAFMRETEQNAEEAFQRARRENIAAMHGGSPSYAGLDRRQRSSGLFGGTIVGLLNSIFD